MALRKHLLVSSHTLSRAAVTVRGAMTWLFVRSSWMLPPLALAFGVRIALLLATQMFIRIIPGQPVRGLFTIWSRFDVGWYLSIVEQGYQYRPQAASNVNFFPLYPITIWMGQHILNPIFGAQADLVAGMAISWLAFAAACVVLYRLVAQRFDHQTAITAIVLLATFPFSFYYGAAYTESLYLLLTVVAFYGVERQAWWLAGVAALFAGAVRPNGFIVGACVVLAYALDWVQQRRPLRWNVLALALTPLGTGAYFVYCAVRFGDPFAYVQVSQQERHAGRIQLGTIVWFLKLLRYANHWLATTNFNTIVWTLYGLLFVAALVGLVFVFRSLGPVYAFFTLASLAAPVLTNPVPTSLGRYISVIFPLFIVLALAVRHRSALREVLTIGCSIFLALFTFLFVMHYPVY